MELIDKNREILADSAKYDVSCSSSGSQRGSKNGRLGSTALPGICHTRAEDGRYVSLLKILIFSNKCILSALIVSTEQATICPEPVLTPRRAGQRHDELL